MSNVVDFVPRVSRVFECSCGNQVFFLHDDGKTECAYCNAIDHSPEGRWQIVPRTAEARSEDAELILAFPVTHDR